jgi:hypothetical protein
MTERRIDLVPDAHYLRRFAYLSVGLMMLGLTPVIAKAIWDAQGGLTPQQWVGTGLIMAGGIVVLALGHKDWLRHDRAELVLVLEQAGLTVPEVKDLSRIQQGRRIAVAGGMLRLDEDNAQLVFESTDIEPVLVEN